MSEQDKFFLNEWLKLVQQMNLTLATIQKEKEMANYPISQNTENWLHVLEFSMEQTINSLDEDVRSEDTNGKD